MPYSLPPATYTSSFLSMKSHCANAKQLKWPKLWFLSPQLSWSTTLCSDINLAVLFVTCPQAKWPESLSLEFPFFQESPVFIIYFVWPENNCHILYLVVYGKRTSLVPVTSSWLEVESSIKKKILATNQKKKSKLIYKPYIAYGYIHLYIPVIYTCIDVHLLYISCFSKCGLQKNSISITWKLKENADSQVPARHTNLESAI